MTVAPLSRRGRGVGGEGDWITGGTIVSSLSRRSWLGSTGALIAGAGTLVAKDNAKPAEPFKFCLNTSTIRIGEGNWGKPRPLVDAIAVASKAGYTAIEPWISEIDDFTKEGGTLKDLGKRITDA